MSEDIKEKMKLVEIDTTKNVNETIDDFKKELSQKVDCVIILATDREGRQYLRSSSMNHLERSFLCQFFNAYLNQWFDLGEERVD